MKILPAIFKKSSRSSQGFTLIELLVVIGILGILAASLVATIDPFEQLKKAQDANVKNILVEFLNSVTRYYTTHNAYPWDALPNGGACNGGKAPSGQALASGPVNGPYTAIDCITTLIGDNELKSAFSLDTADLKNIYATYNNTNNVNQLIGCFLPKSVSQQHDKNTQFIDNQGTQDTTNTCIANGGKTACYWCTR